MPTIIKSADINVEVENQFQRYNLCQLGRDPKKSRNLLPGLQTATNKEELLRTELC